MLPQVLARTAVRCARNLETFRVVVTQGSARASSTIVAQESSYNPDAEMIAHEQSLPPQLQETDYEKQLEALKPSENVWKLAPFKHHKKMRDIINELEIYAYMGTYVPQSLSDDDWYRMLNTTETVGDRVSFLEYLAIKQRRQEKDRQRKSSRQEKFLTQLEQERAKFMRGEMGYGPDLYQLVHNPLRNRKKVHVAQGARMVAAMRCEERPKIALDLQYMFKEKQRVQAELGNQMQYVIS
ncbi:unnamed protein product, partial [Cylicostephanus goldi]